MDYEESTEDSQLPYDLRQAYAEYVRQHMKQLYISKMTNDYPGWLRCLGLLYDSAHNVTSTSKKSKDKDEYQALYMKVITSANKYPDDYLGKRRTPEGITEIEECIRELERNIFLIMRLSGIMGSQRENIGL